MLSLFTSTHLAVVALAAWGNGAHTHPVSDFEACDTRAKLGDDTDGLMTQGET